MVRVESTTPRITPSDSLLHLLAATPVIVIPRQDREMFTRKLSSQLFDDDKGIGDVMAGLQWLGSIAEDPDCVRWIVSFSRRLLSHELIRGDQFRTLVCC